MLLWVVEWFGAWHVSQGFPKLCACLLSLLADIDIHFETKRCFDWIERGFGEFLAAVVQVVGALLFFGADQDDATQHENVSVVCW